MVPRKKIKKKDERTEKMKQLLNNVDMMPKKKHGL